MNPPDAPTAPAPDRRKRVPGAFILVLAILLGAMFLGQRLLTPHPEVDAREDALALVEKGWRVRLETGGDTPGFRDAAARIDAWEGLRRSRGRRSWRLDYRGDAETEEPPSTPTGLRARQDGAAIQLSWDAPAEADAIVLLRARGENESAVERVLEGPVASFRDELTGLVGTYAYGLRARRGGLESAPCDPVRVSFELEPRLTVLEVDLTNRTARIRIGPKEGSPRPRLFLPRPFTVREGAVVGDTVETGFDYRTRWTLKSLAERSREVLVETDVPVFTPEGTRKRDERGRPVSKKMRIPETRPQVVAILERDDGEVTDREPLRSPR